MSSTGAKLRKIALKNVRIFDGHKICEPSTVVIDGDVIGEEEDIQDAEIVDCQNHVLLPGLIDAHVHLHGIESLQQLASYGVTTALDMASPVLEFISSLRNLPNLPSILSAGIPATSPGSFHSRFLAPLMQEHFVASPAEAETFITNCIAEGSDYIKILSDVPGPSQEIVNALTAAARAHGKLTVAHASATEPIKIAQEAGVDILTHAPLDGRLSASEVEKMARENRILVPTLTMMAGVVKNVPRPGLSYTPAKDTVTACHKAGVTILAGTDANQHPGVPAHIPHGSSLHLELQLLVDAGLSNLEAVRAATVLPAEVFGLSDRGVVQPGKRADLVLVDGDPLQRIGDTRRLKKVWIGGVEYKDIVPFEGEAEAR